MDNETDAPEPVAVPDNIERTLRYALTIANSYAKLGEYFTAVEIADALAWLDQQREVDNVD